MSENTAVQTLSSASGVSLRAEARLNGDTVEVKIKKESGPTCVLHWGAVHVGGHCWQVPSSGLPAGSKIGNGFVETTLADSPLELRIESSSRVELLELVLFDPKTSQWDSKQGRNYRILLPVVPLTHTPLQAAQELVKGATTSLGEVTYDLDDGYVLAVVVRSSESKVMVGIATDLPGPLSLHWGVARNRREWRMPAEELRPVGTSVVGPTAVATLFSESDKLRTLVIDIPLVKAPPALAFVVRQEKTEKWWKAGGRDMYVPVMARTAGNLFEAAELVAIADEIIAHETGPGSWTLMHRFNLAWELLDRVPDGSVPGLALIFVWLRFSAIRQLDWQRNYNTKPRELAHAQDRLTAKLAELVANADDETRPVARMIATTVGRGTDGQRVRDGILEIMHRHHVKEVAGHFLEEWHQKLHNNTTPDDVVICEAYLEFLRSNGDPSVFYGACETRGVSRERLLGFERPIRSQPDYIPHLRDALLHDFSDFLGILRAVHSATDFGVALKSAREVLDQGMRQQLDAIWQRRDDRNARSWLFQSITEAREALTSQLTRGRSGLRDLSYLDLSLEDLLRSLVERNLHEALSLDELLEWAALAVRNLVCARRTEELLLCLRHLKRLLTLPRGEHEWALHAQSVLERIRRELVRVTDSDAGLIQPVADYLGEAFGAAKWTIQMFAEEVLRGRFEFVVSALLRKLDEALRRIAGLGHWQVVSRGQGALEGVVRHCQALSEVQGRHFDVNTILVADHISGEEDMPAAVVAVLTESPVDLMAHVAVRARNAGVLFATAWETEQLANVRARVGQSVRLTVTPEGDVVARVGESPGRRSAKTIRVSPVVTPMRIAREYATSERAFHLENVGAKSRNLKELRVHAPEWIRVPAGVALPYGVYERVLAESHNRARADRYHELTRQLRDGTNGAVAPALLELRQLTLELEYPDGLETDLRTAMSDAGVPWPKSFADAWLCIKRVWASKWNDRAHWSRRAMGIADDSLLMAVLVQEVVPADYAFVIHTANPITGDRDDLVAEVVLGLGETLVGNHPGRAFGFRYHRSKRTRRITSFPSKSLGLFGRGLMFRSDSSGEDLMGLAGAGLYDSYMLPQPSPSPLDYEREGLLWNDDLRQRIVEGVTEVGVAVEKIFGAPQDIEGAYSNGHFFVVQARPQVGLDHG